MSDEHVSFDIRALMVEMQNRALNKIAVAAQPNAETAEATAKLLDICNKHGVNTETVFSIVMEFSRTTQEESENEDLSEQN